MKFGKFHNLFRSFKRKKMKGMIKEYYKYGIIEEEFIEMEPYLEKAFEMGRLIKSKAKVSK